MRTKTVLSEIIIALLALLFVYAAISKFLDHRLFRDQLALSPWINSFNGLLSWTLPFAELIMAGLLFFNKTRLVGLYLYAASLIVFSIYITAVLNSGLHIPCSCGGLIQHLSWKQHILFNLSFAVLSIIAIILTRTKTEHSKPYHNSSSTSWA